MNIVRICSLRAAILLFVVFHFFLNNQVLQAAENTTENTYSEEAKVSSDGKEEDNSDGKEEDNEKDVFSPDSKTILDSSGAYVLPEVIVTAARKKSKSEAVQDVPISTYVFSGEVMEEKFVNTLGDVGEMAPNVELRPLGTFPNTLQPYIRGMGMSSSIPSTESPVGLFVDGVYMGVNAGAVNDMFDLESVEVLRGPQGTLFGRNVTGGAVLLRHRRPTGEFGVRGRTTYGNYDFIENSLAVEGPLTDKLSWKMGMYFKDKNGYFKNENIAGTRSRESDTKLLRPMLTWRPLDDLEVTLIGEITKYKGAQDSVVNDRDLGFGTSPAGSKQDLSLGFTPRTEINTEQIVLDINWDLGPGRLTSITGWRQIDLDTGVDADGTVNELLHQVWFVEQHQVTQELRYAFSFLDRVDMTAGVNYFNQWVKSEERIDLGTLANRATMTGVGAPVDNQQSRGILEHTAIGFFSQADIDLTNNLTLTLGGRQTWEKKDAKVDSRKGTGDVGTMDVNFGNYVYDIVDDHIWDFFSAHTALTWRPTEDAMLFGSWTRSFRSGGYNLRNTLNSAVPRGDYGKERVDAFEVGIKTEWFRKRLRTNVSFFFNDFKNLQFTTLNGNAFSISNSADSTIKGFEFETTWFATEDLRLDGSVGYVDAEYDRLDGLDTDFIRDGVANPEAKNNDFNQVPEWTAYLGGEYNIPLAWKYGNDLSIRASTTFSDKYALNEQNDAFQESYFLVDAGMSYTLPGENVKLSIFGKNLTDKRYGGTYLNNLSPSFRPAGGALGIDVRHSATQSVNQGRTVGVSLSFEF